MKFSCMAEGCIYKAPNMEYYRKHIKALHNESFVETSIQLKFSSWDDIKDWCRDQYSDKYAAFYVYADSKKDPMTKQQIYGLYKCHRSGKKTKPGSHKINGECPSRMMAKLDRQTGLITGTFFAHHFGHTMESSIGTVPIARELRDLLAAKLSLGIDKDKILDEIPKRGPHDPNMFVTKRSLNNIARDYAIASPGKHHTDDRRDKLKGRRINEE